MARPRCRSPENRLRIIDGILFYLVAFISFLASQKNKRLGEHGCAHSGSAQVVSDGLIQKGRDTKRGPGPICCSVETYGSAYPTAREGISPILSSARAMFSRELA